MKIQITVRDLVIAAVAFSLSFGAIGYLLAERGALKHDIAVQGKALELVIGIRNDEARYLDAALDKIEELKSQLVEYQMIQHVKRVRPTASAERIVKAVLVSSKPRGFDPRVVLMQMEQESHYDFQATGDIDRLSRGLMQIRPGAAKAVGLNWQADVYNIEKNIEAGVAYLELQRKSSRSITGALWSYNGGGDPLYVDRIHARMRRAFGVDLP